MKKIFLMFSLVIVMGLLLQGCSSNTDNTIIPDNTEKVENNTPVASNVTSEMAYEGVYNYCQSEYDWSVAEENPEIMYVAVGDETENEYKIIFRSYTGSFVYFYVNKTSGITRMVEYVPGIEIEEDAGTINIYDYLTSNE